ncbi:MAG: hypothetical protein ACR2LC_14315 [Pyrinomonadaceae bacterium]
MGWERRRGRLFYYRKERDEQGRVRSIYLGRGESAIDASRAAGVPVPDEVFPEILADNFSAPLNTGMNNWHLTQRTRQCIERIEQLRRSKW